jgi:hypothetical protein
MAAAVKNFKIDSPVLMPPYAGRISLTGLGAVPGPSALLKKTARSR